MHGTNPIRKQELRADGQIEVENVWYTIQGEGPFSGQPAVFVRLSGCWLACHFCDTHFDQYNKLQTHQDVAGIVDICASMRTRLVVLTGGDPLRQNILPLCVLLAARGYHIQIETAGIQWVPGLESLVNDSVLSIVCSPKTGRVCAEMYQYAVAWKYIIASTDKLSYTDRLPLSGTQIAPASSLGDMRVELARPRPFVKELIYVQPCEEDPTSDEAAKRNDANVRLARDIALSEGYRLSLQVHKIIGVE